MYLLKRPLMALSANHHVRDHIVRSPLTKSVVERFVPGDDTAAAVAATRRLVQQGLMVSCDHLGENISQPAQADDTVAAYLDLLQALRKNGLATSAEVSIKLSALGQSLGTDGPDVATRNAHTIIFAAYAQGSRVTLDMEDHTTVDHTLNTLHTLRREFPDVGVAIQAMLHRTPSDLAALVGPGSRVRLVKGAYDEPHSIAHTDASAISLAYQLALKQLFDGVGYPMIGSHDPKLVNLAQQFARESGRTRDEYEFQMLYGIRTLEHTRLARDGRVRVYLPYGNDWYGYLVRRLAERPANLRFFIRSLLSRT